MTRKPNRNDGGRWWACRFCSHAASNHNPIEGCSQCFCMAHPGETHPTTPEGYDGNQIIVGSDPEYVKARAMRDAKQTSPHASVEAAVEVYARNPIADNARSLRTAVESWIALVEAGRA